MHRRWTSPSQIGTWSKCEIDWYYQKVEHRPFQVSWRAHVGTAMGEAANRSLAESVTSGEHLSEDALEQVTRETFRKEWKERPPRADSSAPSKDDAEKKAVEAALCWANTIAYKVRKPVAIEPRIEFQLPDLPVNLLMYPDIIHTDGTQMHTADWKYKGMKVQESEAKYSDQLTAYWWVTAEPQRILNQVPISLLNGEPGKVALGCVVGTKTKTYEQWLESTRHEGYVHQLKRTIAIMEDRIASGIFKPADPNYGFVCGPTCAHWDYCPHGNRDVTLHALQQQGGTA